MDLDAFIGARLAVGIPGMDASEEVIAQLRATHAQSLVVFSRNFTSPEQFTRLLRRLEERLQRRLLVMVDHEGGRIVRFGQGITRFPDAMTVGATQPPEVVERQGRVEAEELRALGVHVNLAPCVDVFVDGADPVIGDRSYGRDPARVSALAAARIRGLQSRGVAACAKHFPGLGAVQRDPHDDLPTIALDWTAMRAIHLPPFEAAIKAGVALVMSSHVCYPLLGDPPGLPATFSRRLIHRLLRETMRFSGPLLTDDLEMGALRTCGTIPPPACSPEASPRYQTAHRPCGPKAGGGTIPEACIRATDAGHDVLLICSDLSAAREALAALRNAYQSGRLSLAELEASVQRISSMRQKILGSPP